VWQLVCRGLVFVLVGGERLVKQESQTDTARPLAATKTNPRYSAAIDLPPIGVAGQN
jgi:hypothetical protein